MSEDRYRVLILGDSFATSLGCFSNNFLDIIKRDNTFNKAVTFYNPSTFNLTTADACCLFEKYLEKNSYDAVVLALGNCDCCAFGYYKRALDGSSAEKYFAKNVKFDGKIKRKNKILRRHPPFTFKYTADAAAPLSGVVSPDDFGRNIFRLNSMCKSRGIPFTLLNLTANRYFPPCNNNGNYSYAKIFGIESRLPYSGLGEFPDLNTALSYHDAGNLGAAENAYREILESDSDAECKLLCLNNLAAICFAQKKYADAAGFLRDAAAFSGNHLYPVILYNSALLEKIIGNAGSAEELFARAMAGDYSSYRIQQVYREVAESNAAGAGIVDAEHCLAMEDFVDYCHPASSGHEKIAVSLLSELGKLLELTEGSCKVEIKYLPANPDYAMGFKTDFFSHFGISVVPDSRMGFRVLEDTAGYGAALKRADNLTADLLVNVVNTIKAHPLFGENTFLSEVHPVCKSDQGRVPEFFFIRQMLPGYKYAAENPAVLSELGLLSGYVADMSKVEQWWSTLKVPAVGNEAEIAARAAEAVDWEKVAERLEMLLDYSVGAGVVYADRIRSITNWFMRESLVFGAVSDKNMFFRRKDFWYIADSCLFYHAFAGKTPGLDRRIAGIVSRASGILEIHNRYSAIINPAFPDSDVTAEYRAALSSL